VLVYNEQIIAAPRDEEPKVELPQHFHFEEPYLRQNAPQLTLW